MRYTKAAVGLDWKYPNLISITSVTGVGKSATMEKFRERCAVVGFEMKFVSVGDDIMAKFAADRGFKSKGELAEFNRLNPQAGYDKACDQEVYRIAWQDNLVIEGRLVHLFAPLAYNVLLTCPLDERALRRFTHQNPDGKSLDQIRDEIAKRDQNDKARYDILYPDWQWPESDFDLVVSTLNCRPVEVVNRIIDAHAAWVEMLKS
jgi:cytidylate kinase